MRRMFSEKQLKEMALATIENANSLKVFENITDEAGHKRFQDISSSLSVRNTFLKEAGRYIGATLSGTHLMVVCAGDIKQDEFVASTRVFDVLFTDNLWILNNIYVTGSTGHIGFFDAIAYKEDGTNKHITVAVWKDSNNYLYATLASTEDFSVGQWSIRFEVDLVIQ